MLRSLRAASLFNLSIAAAILSEDADVALSSTTVDVFRGNRNRQGYPALSTFSWALYSQLRQHSMAMALRIAGLVLRVPLHQIGCQVQT